MTKLQPVITLLLLFFIFVKPVFAHPGNTASDGCHYCRTNCDKWGVPWNQRHCHGGSSTPVKLIYVEPTNTPRPLPTWTPISLPTNTPKPPPTETPAPTRIPDTTPTPAVLGTTDGKSLDIDGFLGAAVIGLILWRLITVKWPFDKILR